MTTTTKEVLEPCPFCGIVPTRRDNVYRYGSIAEHPEGTHCPIENTTIGVNSWNLRTPAPIVAPVSNDRLLEAFKDTAIKCHIGFKHDGPWEECEWVECEDRRKMIQWAATAATVAPQQSDATHCSECGHHRSNLDAEGRCSFGYNYHRNPKDWCGHRCVYENTALAAPASPAALRDEAEAERLRIIAYLSYDTVYSDDFCVRCKHEPSNCECATPVYMTGFEPDEKLKALKVALFQEQRPRAVFDAGFATTPPSILAKAAAEEIALLNKPNHTSEITAMDHCDICMNYKLRIAAIIERCLAGGGRGTQKVEGETNER